MKDAARKDQENAAAARTRDTPGRDTPGRDTADLIERLRQGGESASAIDLAGANLTDADLSGMDLSGRDLRGAQLSRANLSGARLPSAQLAGACLFGADLTGAELLHADLTDADLGDCRARGCSLRGATLTGARLLGAQLPEAVLTGACLDRVDARGANLQRTRLLQVGLAHADLAGADLRDAELDEVDVTTANFFQVDLRGASIRRLNGYRSSNWLQSNITGVDFCNAYIARREIMDQNYLEEFRHQTKAHGVIFWIWWATSDCGRSLLRWTGWTAALAAVFAVVYSQLALDYGDHPTPLSALYYSVVTLTTLGYGDVLPASTAAQVAAMIEVACGYLMLGGLLSIFANKMTRRAE